MNSFRGISLLLTLTTLLSATFVGCDNTPRSADLTWIEPVQLASGETVRIKRHVKMWHERAFGGGAGSAPVYETSSIELVAGSGNFPIWDAPLMPVVIDKDPMNGEWIIVASISGCSVWHRNGRPRPPYWAFRLHDDVWYRDAIPEDLLGRQANLFVDFDVTDDSNLLTEQMEKRKEHQIKSLAHARQYNRVDTAYDEFDKGCSREPSKPIGEDELDLRNFRSLK